MPFDCPPLANWILTRIRCNYRIASIGIFSRRGKTTIEEDGLSLAGALSLRPQLSAGISLLPSIVFPPGKTVNNKINKSFISIL
jgi:hypothetical protein